MIFDISEARSTRRSLFFLCGALFFLKLGNPDFTDASILGVSFQPDIEALLSFLSYLVFALLVCLLCQLILLSSDQEDRLFIDMMNRQQSAAMSMIEAQERITQTQGFRSDINDRDRSAIDKIILSHFERLQKYFDQMDIQRKQRTDNRFESILMRCSKLFVDLGLPFLVTLAAVWI